MLCHAKGGRRPLSGPEDMAGKPGGTNTDTDTAFPAATQANVLCHTLASRRIDRGGITTLLDAVLCDDGKLRVLFGAGTPTTAFHPMEGPAQPCLMSCVMCLVVAL